MHQQQNDSIDPSFAGVPGMRSRFLRASVLVMALSTAGCTSVSAPTPPPAPPEAAAESIEKHDPPVEQSIVTSSPAPASSVASLPSAAVRLPATPAVRPVQPRPPVLQPESLIGLNRDETAAALGTPQSVEERPPATVWAYQAGDCVLEIFFYVNVSTRESRALATNVVSPADSEAGRRNCAQRILAERHVRR